MLEQIRRLGALLGQIRNVATASPEMAEWFGIAIVPNDSELIEVLKPSSSR
ncbi:hypothetical protein [Microbacterium sp.]|uniref:hypothetical protein n=1 Tax=Microbacterium sp. TaxID=51671 RepID=UPI0039E5F19E